MHWCFLLRKQFNFLRQFNRTPLTDVCFPIFLPCSCKFQYAQAGNRACVRIVPNHVFEGPMLADAPAARNPIRAATHREYLCAH
jgi:hypothetical protein